MQCNLIITNLLRSFRGTVICAIHLSYFSCSANNLCLVTNASLFLAEIISTQEYLNRFQRF